MLGPFMLIASVLEEDATNRQVYLPRLSNKVLNWFDFWGSKWVESGYHDISVPLEQCGALFILGGALIPVQEDVRLVWAFPSVLKDGQEESEFFLYEDDGESFGERSLIRLSMISRVDHVVIECQVVVNIYPIEKFIWFLFPIEEVREIKGWDVVSKGTDGRIRYGIKNREIVE